MPFRTVCILIVATNALVMDLWNSRICNWWILISAAIGILLNLSEKGTQGLLDSFTGAALPFILLFGLFFFHLLGTGDIKLFCVLGILQGTEKILYCIGYSFLFGAILAFVIILYTGSVCQRLSYMLEYFRDYFRSGARKSYVIKDMNRMENFHFTVPIMMSVMLYAGGVF
ncbi:MAG: prepilin peptidase [Eubacteriales bacterium]|nr:prepilin peptidase [Eubacteriales bacterium]